MNMAKTEHEIVGCIHIHSRYSDGTGTIPQIAKYAAEAGLDYIMITDHHNLRALKNGEERWYGPVLAIIGYEINDIDDTNHYLAFGLTEEVDKHLPAPEYVRQVRLQGGFGIIAHPDEKRDLLPEHPPYPWTAWESEDYQGIEIWNQMSEWMEGLTPWNKIWRFINPRKSILTPPPETLARWDRVNQIRPVVGIGGVDAHAHQHQLFGGLFKVTIFHYKVQFKSVRTHLLLSEPFTPDMPLKKAKQLVYEAILGCRVFVSNYFNGDARGFRVTARNTHGKAGIGESLPWAPDTTIRVRVPLPGRIRLIRNGEQMAEEYGQEVDFTLSAPGIYRVEVFRRKRAWIFSNHLRLIKGD